MFRTERSLDGRTGCKQRKLGYTGTREKASRFAGVDEAGRVDRPAIVGPRRTRGPPRPIGWTGRSSSDRKAKAGAVGLISRRTVGQSGGGLRGSFASRPPHLFLRTRGGSHPSPRRRPLQPTQTTQTTNGVTPRASGHDLVCPCRRTGCPNGLPNGRATWPLDPQGVSAGWPDRRHTRRSSQDDRCAKEDGASGASRSPRPCNDSAR